MAHLRRIAGLRNRIIHGYDLVDQQLLWAVIRDELPALMAQLTDALAEADE